MANAWKATVFMSFQDFAVGGFVSRLVFQAAAKHDVRPAVHAFKDTNAFMMRLEKRVPDLIVADMRSAMHALLTLGRLIPGAIPVLIVSEIPREEVNFTLISAGIDMQHFRFAEYAEVELIFNSLYEQFQIILHSANRKP